MSEPKVSIIVTSYLPESKRYLDLCMQSIVNLSYKNVETIVVGRPDYLPQYEIAQTISPPEDEFLNGRGINYGVEQSSGKYLFILNDDVILTKDCIQPLVNALIKQPIIGQVMPVGNDQQGRYHINSLIEHFNLMKNSGILDRSFDMWTSPSWQIFCDTLCLYAHMLSKDTWNKIGPMDDNAGLIDIDYSLRMRQSGRLNAIEMSSLVWHFGGVSVEKTLDGPKRIKQKDQFQAKWGWRP